MKKYSYDLHVHTSQSSICAYSTGASLVDKYIAAGYSGFVTTDHFIGAPNCRLGGEKSWRDKITRFCSGYYDALNRGIQRGFNVFFGFEFYYNYTEFIILNLSPEKLIGLGEDIVMDKLPNILQSFHTAGGFIIHAHPFRHSNNTKIIRLLPELIDAVEGFNGENIFLWPNANKFAKIYAEAINKPCVSGSDFHGDSGIITGGMTFTKQINSSEEMILEISAGRGEMIEKSIF